MADNNNNYSNFNGYQPPQGQPVPAQPIYIQPDLGAQQREADAKKATSLGIWSIVCSTLLCCCCGIGPIIGLILSIIGLKKQKGNVTCIIGLVISALILALNAYSMLTTDWSSFTTQYQQMMEQYQEALNDPESFMEQYGQGYGQGYGQNGGQDFDLNNAFGAIFRF